MQTATPTVAPRPRDFVRVAGPGDDDFLQLTEPGLGDVVARTLLRMRFASKCEIEPEQHVSTLVLGGGVDGIANEDYGVPAVELIDTDVTGAPADADELERLRIL